MKKLLNSIAYYLVVQACKRVNSSNNGIFRYEIMGVAQPEIKL